MPKSKRNKQVTLSKTKKKGRVHKEAFVDSIREAADKYDSAYVFTYENMRNLKFKEFRDKLKSSSRFFLGSNKVMQVALGRSVSDEIKPGIYNLSKLLRGNSGLCFTNLPKGEVLSLFNDYEELDFARTGGLALEKVELKEGHLDQFSHEMEPLLRKLGLPTKLEKGDVMLTSDHVVCEAGKPISPETSRILRLLGIKMATFKLHLICRWKTDEFELYKELLDQSDDESS
ncbi:mRNA turnover protein 4 homolog [Impatiens glandulifera]|uniref:mRNA turnover protein 4 homolog n=1 Tax=Impatiens glandulifera TaxID=253017 RepID=UPI001FB0A49C|nr:mRNA turnover protein 4 homolog [Impatiens glandulifera]